MAHLYFVLLLMLTLAGCSVKEPGDAPHIQPSVDGKRKSIVLVTESWCSPCQQQKALIKQMQRAGKLKDVDYRTTDSRDPNYPATHIPTLYICNTRGVCVKRVGLQSEAQILKDLK